MVTPRGSRRLPSHSLFGSLLSGCSLVAPLGVACMLGRRTSQDCAGHAAGDSTAQTSGCGLVGSSPEFRGVFPDGVVGSPSLKC